MSALTSDEAHDALARHLMGPLVQYYDDPSVSEIMINGPYEIFVDGKDGIVKTDLRMKDDAALRGLARVILQYSGKRLTPHDLSIEARMPNNSRVHIVQSPAARAGITLAIRQFASNPPTIEDLEKSGSLSPEAIDFLRVAVNDHKNIII